jgi:MoaA/NifB/PqqE/SkfB family radical SAM enzyme
MCPRDAIEHPELMSIATWTRALQRISPEEVFRVVIAGYGEPTTHPRFFEFVDALRGHPVPFDMVSNGHLLDSNKIEHLDGAIRQLIVSFSSIDPAVYRCVHVNLDQRRVMANLRAAQKKLKHTRLAVSLTPLSQCLASLPETIAWLRAQGIGALTMSPTLYNRGGNMTGHETATATLRRLIRQHRLHAQDLDFVPSVREVFRQWRRNRFKCVPRNVDLFVAASGDYLYCYNDIEHVNPIGNVHADGIRDTLLRREAMGPVASLCGACNMRGRYGLRELIESGVAYARSG